MSVCTGASQAKAGVPASIVVDPAYLKQILPPVLDWLYPYLPFMHGLSIGNVGAFCSVDPPAVTVPDAVELFAFLSGGGIGQTVAVTQFLQDVTKAYLWYNLCECASGSPTPYTAPTAPADLPGYNTTPYVSLPATVPCQVLELYTGDYAIGANLETSNRFTLPAHDDDAYRIPIPVNVTSYRFTGRIIHTSGLGAANGFFGLEWHYSQSGITRTDGWQWFGSNFTVVGSIPPGTNSLHTYTSSFNVIGAGVTTDYANGTLELFCDGAVPGGTISPCCPPDTIANGVLQQILATVTLIQRQIVPFAYVAGTAHTGLTGTGEFSVQGTLGLAATFTTLPSRVGTSEGTPDLLFGTGWINLGTVDGWTDRHRIASDPYLLLPPDMSTITRVGYTVPPDCVVTITELEREP